jgi:hypothetical protein
MERIDQTSSEFLSDSDSQCFYIEEDIKLRFNLDDYKTYKWSATTYKELENKIKISAHSVLVKLTIDELLTERYYVNQKAPQNSGTGKNPYIAYLVAINDFIYKNYKPLNMIREYKNILLNKEPLAKLLEYNEGQQYFILKGNRGDWKIQLGKEHGAYIWECKSIHSYDPFSFKLDVYYSKTYPGQFFEMEWRCFYP